MKDLTSDSIHFATYKTTLIRHMSGFTNFIMANVTAGWKIDDLQKLCLADYILYGTY